MKQLTLILATLTFTIIPLFAAAQTETDPGYLIVCDGVTASSSDPNFDECGFEDLFELVNRVVNILIFIALFISTLVFIWAGALYLISSDKRDQTQRAKDMMKKAAIGIILLLIAWVAVYSISTLLGLDERYNFLEQVDP